MFKILSVTNRKLCREPLSERGKKLIRAGIDGMILREKDLGEDAYRDFSGQLLKEWGESTILHGFPKAAACLDVSRIHLPLPVLRTLSPEQRSFFTILGASCHSLADAREAEDLGCNYVTLGHIFATDCKKDLPPRGLAFLEATARAVDLPVFAIGGIKKENIRQIRETGASGACIMSSLMICEDPRKELEALRKALE